MITHEFSDAANKRLGWVFLLLASLGLCRVIWCYSADRDFVRSSRLTTGQVIAVEKNQTLLTIRCMDASQREVTFQPNTWSFMDEFSVGQFVEVLHNGKVPSEAKVNRWSHVWGNTMGSVVFYVMYSAFAAFTLSGKMRWGPLKKTLFTVVGG